MPKRKRNRVGLRLTIVKIAAILLVLACVSAFQFVPSITASPVQGTQEQKRRFSLTVVDENLVAVAAARVLFLHPDAQGAFKGETDFAGRCEIAGLQPGRYQLRVEKEGFYAEVIN